MELIVRLSLLWPMGDDVQLWSEFTPTLYRLLVKIERRSDKIKISKQR